MASIKVYAPSLASSGAEIRDVLEDAGHTVTLVVSGGIGSHSGFDALVVQHSSFSIASITDYIDAGKPVLVVGHAGSIAGAAGTGLTNAHVMLSLGLAGTFSQGRYFSSLTELDTDHEITAGLSDPLFYLNSGKAAQQVLDLPLANIAGAVLAYGDPVVDTDSDGPNDLSAGASVVIFEVGTIYQKSGASTSASARVGYLGAGAPTTGNGNPTGYSVEGATLLVRLVEWLLGGVASPAQPVIIVSSTTNDAVIGALSAYAHTGDVPARARYVWLERADGSYIVEPFSIAVEDTSFVVEGATESGFVGAQDEDENGLLSVKAVRKAYTLEPGSGGSEEAVEPGEIEVTDNDVRIMWGWPTALLSAHFNIVTPSGMTPYYRRVDIVSGGDTLGSQVSLLSADLNASFAWLKPGNIYTIRAGTKGAYGGGYPFVYNEFLVEIPHAFVSPRFDLRHGALVRGATFSLEWYESPNCALVPGDDRVELTYDGVVFIPITTLNFAANEVAGKVTHVLDTTLLTDGRARFSVVRETEGGDAPRRYSPVVFIDNAELCTRIEGEDLLLSAFNVIGGVDEASYWTEDVYGGVPILKREAPANTGGRLVLDVDFPRGFGAVAEGMFASGGDAATGVFNGLQYLPDTALAWGVSGYVTEQRKMMEARFKGVGAAIGTAYSVYEGAPAYNWLLGNVYGRGLGELQIATHDGSDTVHVERADEGKQQYNRVLASAGRWWQDVPWYGVEGFFQQASTTPQALLLQASLHGGETEDEFAPVVEYAAVGGGYPCGNPAVCAISADRPTVFYLRSFTVYPIAYGDCAVGAPEPPPAGSVGLPLEKAWAFPLDGHVFYVLNLLEENRTFVYDAVTRQWARWFTREQPFWNMFRGITWQGVTIAADFASAKIWALKPTSLLDEDAYQISRTVTGVTLVRGKERFPVGSLKVTASMGEPSATGALLRVRYSDDGGNTFSGYFDVMLEIGAYRQDAKFRSLGSMKAPGRIWEFSDSGGAVRIDDVSAVMDEPS